MLILTRRAEIDQDTILIGEKSRIILLRLLDASATVGFKFPDEISIARKEIANPNEADPPRENGKIFSLTMTQEERVIIGNEITFAITDITGSEVKFGINAPRNVLILRGELLPNSVEGRLRPSPPERR